MYYNSYTQLCHSQTQTQVDFLSNTFSQSNATWKFLQLHHPYRSAATNETDLQPLIDIVVQHNGVVLNGHDHCLGHFYSNNTNFILSGAAGYPQAGDCNNGIAPGEYALFLGANNLTGELFLSSMLYFLPYLSRNLIFHERIMIRRIFSHDHFLISWVAANGFVTMDISQDLVNVEYYARDMKFEGSDLYPVECDLKPSYSFQITQKAT